MKEKHFWILFIFNLLFILFYINSISAISEERCDYIYFWISQNNYVYTNISLINANISLNSIYDYSRLCQNSDYPELPQPSLKKLIIYENQQEECNYKDGFGKEYIPFFEIEFNEMNCSSLKKWSYLADFEEKQTGFSAVGVNAYLTVFFAFLFILAIIKISTRENENES